MGRGDPAHFETLKVETEEGPFWATVEAPEPTAAMLTLLTALSFFPVVGGKIPTVLVIRRMKRGTAVLKVPNITVQAGFQSYATRSFWEMVGLGTQAAAVEVALVADLRAAMGMSEEEKGDPS